jgi:4-amino-4-deoxy-L-arabinose transferase-like glycosyltransferase
MLTSWENFFFVAAEPGGSVTVDKPPLGLWVQAAFAYVFSVSGVVVSLPQVIAGILSIPLLFHLVRKYFGAGAGLLAAFVLAVTPVSIAVERNNTIDAQLIFVLLLAAWAFVRATETSKTRWLLVGAVLVGVGFNIKMMQAFLPLPAFYALYFFGAHTRWGRKIVALVIATVLMLAVSLSWAVAVDLTRADQRPYIGSSENNSVLELMLGYNGLNRLLGLNNGAPRDDGSAATGQTETAAQTRPNAPQGFTPPSQPTDADAAPARFPGAMGGGMFGGETGQAGVLRLFQSALANEIGWLLPFGLLGLVVFALRERIRFPLSTAQQGAVLWGGWLLVGVVFFSMAGFFHAYYTAMLAPALAACIGITIWALWMMRARRPRLSTLVLLGAAAGTLIYQALTAAGYSVAVSWLPLMAAGLGLGALLLFAAFHHRWTRLAGGGFIMVVAALLITPTVWSAQTTLDSRPNNVLPSAYEGERAGGFPAGLPEMGSSVSQALIDYLQPRTQGMDWMMAVNSSMTGSPYVLATGRGILLMGGFSGQDQVVTPDTLAALVQANRLRYVLSQGAGMPGMGGGSDVSSWLAETCTPVTDVDLTPSAQIPEDGAAMTLPAMPTSGMFGRSNSTLYDCAA